MTKNANTIARHLRAIVDTGEPWARLNEMSDDCQRRQSLAMGARSLARYLAQHVFTDSPVDFLNACGVRP